MVVKLNEYESEKNIGISTEPSSEKSPYNRLRKLNLVVDFEFIHVEGVIAKEVRKQKLI